MSSSKTASGTLKMPARRYGDPEHKGDNAARMAHSRFCATLGTFVDWQTFKTLSGYQPRATKPEPPKMPTGWHMRLRHGQRAEPGDLFYSQVLKKWIPSSPGFICANGDICRPYQKIQRSNMAKRLAATSAEHQEDLARKAFLLHQLELIEQKLGNNPPPNHQPGEST